MATKQVKMATAKQSTQKGGTGAGGTKGGISNEQLKKLGRSAARAAANGKGY